MILNATEDHGRTPHLRTRVRVSVKHKRQRAPATHAVARAPSGGPPPGEPPVAPFRLSASAEYPAGLPDTLHARLKWAREKAGYTSARKFAAQVITEKGEPMRPNAYTLKEGDKREIKIVELAQFCDILGVDITWLVTGRGHPSADVRPEPNSNLVWAPRIEWEDAHDVDAIAAGRVRTKLNPVPVVNDRDTVFALTVRDQSMAEIAPKGSTIVVDYSGWWELGQNRVFLIYEASRGVIFRRYATRDHQPGFEAAPLDPNDPAADEWIPYTDEVEIIGRVLPLRAG